MEQDSVDITFTGEFFVPGKAGVRIEADHVERYVFATQRANAKSVLDIACGAGYAGPMFSAAGALSYDGVDLKQELQIYATRKYGSEKVSYHTGDIRSFNVGKQYDLIVCFETIEHLAGYREALLNLHLLLRSGGQLLISSPNRPITSPGAKHLGEKPANEYHTQEFTPEELAAELRAAGFDVDQIYGQRLRRVFPLPRLNALVKRLLGNPDSVTSAKVTPMAGKTPRYFVVAASKA